MAKFKIAEALTGGNEGLYANNPQDKGGETYAGISRNNWPSWVGWKLIDSIKAKYGSTAKIINMHARVDTVLSQLISNFYKSNFWDVNKLDLINDQQLANTVYDFGVNSGTGRAARYLQTAATKATGTKLVLDGAIGVLTLAAVNSADPAKMYSYFNSLRKAFYVNQAVGDQRQFLSSWLSRLTPYNPIA